jgi:uncharacterized Fe-S center protein
MPSELYLARVSDGGDAAHVQERVRTAFTAAGLEGCFREKDLVAIKVHFGERGHKTFVPAEHVRSIVDCVKDGGGLPFLTDTNTLYRGQRDNAVNHLNLAFEHGFTPENVGAPVVIADGPSGSAEIEVPVDGKHYRTVGVAEGIVSANALVVVTHATGHPGAGLGGVIKNLGMGLSSKKGKLAQHSKSRPSVAAKTCTACGRCLPMCPVDAILWREEKAWIDEEKCIGCGECLAMCRFGAVRFSWDQASEDLQERMAEHALGAVKNRGDRVGYVTFLMAMTKGCDCFGQPMDPLVPDVGVLAGRDPVAMDAAALELARDAGGRSLPEIAWSDVNPNVQIDYAAELGLGSRDYSIIEV